LRLFAGLGSDDWSRGPLAPLARCLRSRDIAAVAVLGRPAANLLPRLLALRRGIAVVVLLGSIACFFARPIPTAFE
jgi:hypothetical protein